MSTVREVSAVAFVATGFYLLNLVLFASLHFSGSGYTPLRHAVSDYGVGRSAGLFQAYVWIGNFGALALAYLFYASAEPRFPPFVPLCMLFMVAAGVGVSVFKTDLEGAGRTRQGTLHYLFAVLTFASAYVVIDNATPLLTTFALARDLPQEWLLTRLRYTAMISLIGVVVTVFRPLRRFFGRVERVFLVSTLVWFLVANYAFIGR